jgi:hypothetical protein
VIFGVGQVRMTDTKEVLLYSARVSRVKTLETRGFHNQRCQAAEIHQCATGAFSLDVVIVVP